MSYKQFIQELEDDMLPSEAERRYQEYKSEYISTQKGAYFDAHKGEDWLKDKYHPTNLLAVIESRHWKAGLFQFRPLSLGNGNSPNHISHGSSSYLVTTTIPSTVGCR